MDGGNRAQGLTKKVSYVRHFIAFDEFCKLQRDQELDASNTQQKKLFTECVARVVRVRLGAYTPNFIDVKVNADCGVGSNFFGGGPVLVSAKSPRTLQYPMHGDPLFDVQRQKLRFANNAYVNLARYVEDDKIRVALFVWLSRSFNGFSSRENLYSELRNQVATVYSQQLLKSIFPTEELFMSRIDDFTGELFNDEESLFSDLDFSATHKTFSMRGRDVSRQQIRYGAPGTGKSFGLDGESRENDVYRTTFHPDSDYSTFIGAYKPTMKKVPRIVQIGQDIKTPNYAAGFDESLKVEEKIAYEFCPQAFMNAYVAAWKEVAKGTAGKPVVLVIEEINRGNCAQVFGDIFQLLDRDDATGWSSYPIDADADLAKWLNAVCEKKADGTDGDPIFSAKLDAIVKPAKIKDSDWADIKIGKKLALPPNLYIWATMNTSDQSLFPIDSAFKRRWDWQYVPIAKPDKDDDENWRDRAIKAGDNYYDWYDFITIVNKHIAKTTQSEDKQLGYFFVKAPDDTGIITAEKFVNKVLFFLFKDAFKDWKLPEGVFGKANNEKYAFKDFFYCEKEGEHKVGDIREDVLAEFLEHLQWEGEKLTASTDAPKTNGEKANPAEATPANESPSSEEQPVEAGQSQLASQSTEAESSVESAE